MDIKDSIIVVTGGGSGIGEAIARAAVERGARHVAVADLNGDEARRVAEDIGGSWVELDVRDEQGIVDLVQRIESEQGPIDLFVSNAGIVTAGGVEESNEILQLLWEVHVMAHIYAARAVLPSMIERGHGHLMSVASAAGLLMQLGSLSYSITKHAAVAVAEFLAVHHHHQGIRTSIVCPQAVATNLLRNNPVAPLDEDIGGGEGEHAAALDGVLQPADVARSALDGVEEERFLILPHAEVEQYYKNRANDPERWLGGMRKLHRMLYPEGQRPGDVIAPPDTVTGPTE
jgi:NAD(P)-dependent dehydrogenase (short-subunit alcohol dehydrogenase family)